MNANPDPASLRAERKQLRNVSRLLRWSGIALAVIGAAGLIVARPGGWWVGPSWFSLVAGLLLALASVVTRVRDARKPPPGAG